MIHHRPSHVYPEGFTLIELLIGIAIIAILASISVPNFRPLMTKYRLDGAARQLMGDLMAARMRAVSQNRNVEIFFSDNHQYRICDDADGNGTVGNCEGNAQLKDIQTNYSDVTLVSTNNPIFTPKGTATNLPTITLTNSSGSKSITIAITGRVKIN
jgi:type IV fimbrial biogenesis protein FimT